ncbi:MAG TPA: DEAD/DEAH box helicase family protein [Candidatus Methanofastidiosa archaeon]|nr:DEAD/DEAH box helicase family protein [Candidatus Methanofastidiosa archaeon]
MNELGTEGGDMDNDEPDDLRGFVERNIDLDKVKREHLESFFDVPYALLPKDKNEVWLVVPKFIPFQLGYLDRQTESYNIFVINKYVDWISPLPDDIKAKVGIRSKFRKAVLSGDILELGDRDECDKAERSYSPLVSRRLDDVRLRIKKGKEFELLASLIDGGNLPFIRTPVDQGELRSPPRKIELRDYQMRAWEMFLDTGKIGVYWPPSAGKTYLSLYAGERIIGNKLVVVPSNTLKEQWLQRIRKYCRYPEEWNVHTYQMLTGRKNWIYSMGNISLTIFDEAHHLPANSFSRLATINTRYRIGLSASPYREDGRIDYIFALTGFPVGLRWQELISMKVIEEPDIKVIVYSTREEKRKGLLQLVPNYAGDIIIFCDSLKLGRELSDELDIPFIYGSTKDRMEVLRTNRVVIMSRVGDEGVSLPELETVIEYDFFGGSRRQEVQRVGRIMHGNKKGEHIILMTDDELQKYEKRLYSLEEQGFRIDVMR